MARKPDNTPLEPVDTLPSVESPQSIRVRVADIHDMEEGSAHDPAPTYNDMTAVDASAGATIPDALDPKGNDFFDKGSWEERIATLKEELADTDNTEAQIELLLDIGSIYDEKLNDLRAAVRCYTRVLEFDPNEDRAFDELERLYAKAGSTEKLIKLLVNRAEDLAEASKQAQLLKRAADLYVELGEIEKATITLQAAQQVDPDNPALAALLDLLRSPVANTQTVDPIEILTQQLKQSDAPALRIDLFERMVDIYTKRGQHGQVVHCLEEILSLDPRRVACHRKLERLYKEESRHTELASVLERHIEVAPPEERLVLLGQLARLSEEVFEAPERAAEHYERLLTLDPGHRPTLQALGRLYRQQQDWQREAGILQRQIEHAPSDHARRELLFRIAEIHQIHCNDTTNAEAHYLQALKDSPAEEKVISRLTEIYRQRRDWGKLVKLLLESARGSSSPHQEASFLCQAGMAALNGLEDQDRAAELFEQAMTADPDHAAAAAPLSQIYWSRKDHDRIEPLLELLLRKLAPEETAERIILLSRQGSVAETTGKLDRAVQLYRQVVALDTSHIPSLLGLARGVFAAEQWSEARSYFRQAMELRSRLDDQQLAEIQYMLGVCARKLDDGIASTEHLERVLQLDPLHRPTLELLAEIYVEDQRWQDAVELKTLWLEGAEEKDKVQAYHEMGPILWHRLQQAKPAEDALRAGLALSPDHHMLLHDLIDLYSESNQWKKTITTCERMAQIETKPALKVKYLMTIAVIYRDQLQDPDRALEVVNEALDANPFELAAFEHIDKICTAQRAWKKLDRYYRQMIHRLPAEGHQELKVMLWHNLGEVLRSRRRDFEGAIAAFEVAQALDPQHLDRKRIIAELLLASGEAFAERAIAAHHELLRRAPGEFGVYRILRSLYMDRGQYDRAWCFCAALVILQQANNEEAGFYRQYKRSKVIQSNRQLDDEIWRKFIHHPQQSQSLNSIFATLAPVIASLTVRPVSHYKLRQQDHRGKLKKDGHPYLLLFDYLTSILNVSKAELFLRPKGSEGLMMAHTPGLPSFVVGGKVLQGCTQQQAAFISAKKLALLRPEHFLRCALPSQPQLKTVLLAVLKLLNPALSLPEQNSEGVDPMVDRMRQHLHPIQLEVLQRLTRPFTVESILAEVHRWWDALELTSDRAGMLLCNDLETAVELIKTEPGISDLKPTERIKQLIQYTTSEIYLQLREQLGLVIG